MSNNNNDNQQQQQQQQQGTTSTKTTNNYGSTPTTTTNNNTTKEKNSIFLVPAQTRLVTICAHVDHGKTTLADNLIEANGIISERLAGTIRYLDSTEEEQRRGITMRASAIGLRHQYYFPTGGGGTGGGAGGGVGNGRGGGGGRVGPAKKQQQQLGNATIASSIPTIIHLLDSPGHTDFSMEVSSSLQCCDGCILVVDAVEGMCARTHQVVREAHSHQLIPILVINKVDRLCTDLCLTPTEAYVRLRTLLESVNAACAAMLVSKRAEDENNNSINHNSNNNNGLINNNGRKHTQQKNNNNNDNNTNQVDDHDHDNYDEEVQRWTFEPANGNVIFASALYGWGFTIPSLARSLFRQKIVPIKPIVLKQYLFGDFFLKEKKDTIAGSETKVMKWKQAPSSSPSSSSDSSSNIPLFAEFALQPLWDIYEGIATAASICGLGPNLFSDGRAAVANNSSSTGNNNNKVKIEATTPGMDQVLHAMQIGNTAAAANSNNSNNNIDVNHNTNTNIIDSQESLQRILIQTGSASSEEATLRSLLRRYRPLSDCVLNAVYEICPSPQQASETVRPRALALVDATTTIVLKKENNAHDESTTTSMATHHNGVSLDKFYRIQQSVRSCDVSLDAPIVAHVCKFMAADRKSIRDPYLADFPNIEIRRDGNGTDGTTSLVSSSTTPSSSSSSSSSVILGLARVLSGRLRTGDSYHVLGPKHKFQLGDDDATVTGNWKQETMMSHPIRLYLLMGSSFVLVDEVPAGHLCAIQNLENIPFKTTTLCDSPYGMPLRGFTDSGMRPLVKVNVEAVNPSDTGSLERGLVKLSLADAAVEVNATSRGERILACLGELHLEQSIIDLQRVYCDRKDIELRISEPIVEFGETTDWFSEYEKTDFETFLDKQSTTVPLRQLTIPPYNEEEGIDHTDRGRTRSIISGRLGAISLRVVPLDPSIYQSLKKGTVVLGATDSECFDILRKALGLSSDVTPDILLKNVSDSVISMDDSGNVIMASSALENGLTVVGVVGTDKGQVYVPTKKKNKSGCGDHNDGSYGGDNGAINNNEKVDEDDGNASSSGGGISTNHNDGLHQYQAVQKRIRDNGFGPPSSTTTDTSQSTQQLSPPDTAALAIWKEELKGSVVAGFQMAMRHGPVCEEPVRSVLVVLEGLEVALKKETVTEAHVESSDDVPDNSSNFKPAAPLSGGMVAACLRIGIRSALLSRPIRLVESHLKLTLNSSLTGLGSLYNVLSKRRGKVLDDSMVDGTDLLQITAIIPHAESFGLAPELFRQSSGEVTAPELIFSHWEKLDQDPFWIPTSLEEREDFGEILVSGDVSTGLDNTALKYIRRVRERKGLIVDSIRTVLAAEKQRTIKR